MVISTRIIAQLIKAKPNIQAYLDKDEKEKENGRYIRKERYAGACSRSFYVGEDITEEDIKAEFKQMCIRDSTEGSQKLITFGNLKDGLIRGTKFDRTAEQKLEKLLQDKDPEKIQKACTSLGAEFIETEADLCAVFPVFPRYPVTLKIWFADEEFPVSGKIFLQDHADHYLSVEDAVTVGEICLLYTSRCV